MPNEEVCDAALAFQGANAGRIERLKLKDCFDLEQPLHHPDPPLSFDCLQELRLSSDWSTADVTTTSLFRDAPRLTRCFIAQADFTRSGFVGFVPLQSLRSLHLWDVDMMPDDIFEALHSMPQLSRLNLWLFDGNPDDHSEPDKKYDRQIPLLHLMSMCVRFGDARYMRKVVTFIQAPNLQRFHATSLAAEDLKVLRRGADESDLRFPSLTVITIDAPVTTDYLVHFEGIFVDLLRRLPGLQRLNIASDKYFFDTRILSGALLARPTGALLARPTGALEDPVLDIQPVCPQLQEPYVKGCKVLVVFKELQDVIKQPLAKAGHALVE